MEITRAVHVMLKPSRHCFRTYIVHKNKDGGDDISNDTNKGQTDIGVAQSSNYSRAVHVIELGRHCLKAYMIDEGK